MNDDDQAPVRGQVGLPETGTEEDREATLADGRRGRHRAERRSEHMGSGDRGRGRSRRKDTERQRGSFMRELPVLVVVALVLAFVIKAFLVQAFYIPSGSMENTLRIGDRVLVNKLVYHLRPIHRGDIVVFNGLDSFTPEVHYTPPKNPVLRFLRSVGGAFGITPPGEKDFIKRVIGVPGDHVSCCDAQGRVNVNGTPLTGESYIYPGDHPSEISFDVTVPKGRLWVMGDHRSVSADSRAHLGDPGGGTVPADKVIGRAFVVVWPPSHLDWLSGPQTFDQPALQAAEALVPAAPYALGAVGAVPFALARRRLRRARRGRARSRPGRERSDP